MQPISEVMTDMTEKMAGTKVQKFCEYCGKELEQNTFLCCGVMRYMPTHKLCNCDKAVETRRKKIEEEKKRAELEKLAIQEKRKKEKIERLLGSSGMTQRAMNCKFEGYQLSIYNENAFKICKNYADNFSYIKLSKKNGLFIAGPCGVGKSHLAFAIVNDLINNQRVSVISMTMIDLLMKIKSSYDSESKNEEDILKIYEDCSLLVIDDLGKERPTEWALQMIYTIIDRRYNSMKPIIVTTNYSAQELIKRLSIGDDCLSATAIVDRLYEMCEYIPIKGESYRKN